jgi:acyl-CoA thioester hydrolase
MEHALELNVYVSDTDLGGVVYYANYLKFCEHARTEFYNSIGFQQRQVLKDFNMGFMVKEVVLELNAPSTLDDRLIIVTKITDLSRSSFKTIQTIYKNDRESKPISVVKQVLICVNATLLKPMPIPEDLSNELKKYLD